MRLSLNNRIARQKEREPGEFSSVAINLAQLRTALHGCVYVREKAEYMPPSEKQNVQLVGQVLMTTIRNSV